MNQIRSDGVTKEEKRKKKQGRRSVYPGRGNRITQRGRNTTEQSIRLGCRSWQAGCQNWDRLLLSIRKAAFERKTANGAAKQNMAGKYNELLSPFFELHESEPEMLHIG